jgi:hypothetical protein
VADWELPCAPGSSRRGKARFFLRPEACRHNPRDSVRSREASCGGGELCRDRGKLPSRQRRLHVSTEASLASPQDPFGRRQASVTRRKLPWRHRNFPGPVGSLRTDLASFHRTSEPSLPARKLAGELRKLPIRRIPIRSATEAPVPAQERGSPLRKPGNRKRGRAEARPRKPTTGCQRTLQAGSTWQPWEGCEGSASWAAWEASPPAAPGWPSRPCGRGTAAARTPRASPPGCRNAA